MPEARDRLSRQGDFIAAYSQRKISRTDNRSIGRGSSILFVLGDGHEEGQGTRTPFRWRDTTMVGTPGSIGLAARRGVTGSPRIRLFSPLTGPENLSPVVGSGRGSTLPRYPRRPLNDITAATVRRREGRTNGVSLDTESRILQGWISDDPSIITSEVAQLEHNLSMISPRPTLLGSRHPPTIGKILLNITHKNDEDSSCLTPQKKLLNNIDTVEKVVMEELQKLKRTPSAKKAEREKRVRTLMSMR